MQASAHQKISIIHSYFSVDRKSCVAFV